MNILAVLPSYRAERPVGGGELSNQLLFENLVAQGHTVTVIAFNGLGVAEGNLRGVRVFQTSRGRGNRQTDWIECRVRLYLYAKKLLNEISPDIILSSNEVLSVGKRLAGNARVSCGALVRAYENFVRFGCGFSRSALPAARWRDWVKRALLGNFGQSAVSGCDFVITNSQYMRTVCEANFSGPPAYTVYPPVVVPKKVPKVKAEEIKVISLATTRAEKGGPLISRVATHFPKIEFRFVGCPKILSDQKIIAENITQVGWRDLAKEFEGCSDLVLVPSQWQEPFGRVAVESLLAGKPVLVSNVGGLPEAVGREESLTIDSDDEQMWVESITNVCAGSGSIIAATSKAQQKARQFDVKVQGEKLANILGDFI